MEQDIQYVDAYGNIVAGPSESSKARAAKRSLSSVSSLDSGKGVVCSSTSQAPPDAKKLKKKRGSLFLAARRRVLLTTTAKRGKNRPMAARTRPVPMATTTYLTTACRWQMIFTLSAPHAVPSAKAATLGRQRLQCGTSCKESSTQTRTSSYRELPRSQYARLPFEAQLNGVVRAELELV